MDNGANNHKDSGWARHGLKFIGVLAVLAAGVGGMEWLKSHGPEASKEAPEPIIPVVRIVTAEFHDLQLYVNTQGRVDPRRKSQAAAEVAGRVVRVSENFRPGGSFVEGEVMLEIDDADYIALAAQAEANLADAKLNLAREEARAEQAQRDWNKLGRGKPSDLVLGKPQILSARARVKASEANLDKANRDLTRTKIKAPYNCLIETISTELGSYISPGVRLASLFSVGSYEVRVPVTLEELGFLEQDKEKVLAANVQLQAEIGGVNRTWQGKILRSEGQVDRSTMTIHLVVSIAPNPNSKTFSYPPPGLFVRAKIKGRIMTNVAELPRGALRQNNTLLILDEKNQLKIVQIGISRTRKKTVLVANGINEGDRVVVSPMEAPVEGMKLEVSSSR